MITTTTMSYLVTFNMYRYYHTKLACQMGAYHGCFARKRRTDTESAGVEIPEITSSQSLYKLVGIQLSHMGFLRDYLVKIPFI